MSDVIVGILAILAGLVFCFSGYWAMRLVITIWGAFAGFGVGSGLISSINDESYLVSATAWIVGVAFALVFALFAYLYFAVGVVIAMASAGFALGASVMVALGVSWDWVTVSIGIACGAILALLAILLNLPRVVLTVVSALAGATAVVGGLMLLFGSLDTADFNSDAVTTGIRDDWWWYVLFLVVALAGMFAQFLTASIRGGMRQGWAGPDENA
ncbi:MAG: TM7S3/TM198-like domain-containing protein [Aeromicrobium sp.]